MSLSRVTWIVSVMVIGLLVGCQTESAPDRDRQAFAPMDERVSESPHDYGGRAQVT